MRVLIQEQEFQGHYYQYLGLIIPSLAELVDEVVVAITPYGAESVEYQHHIAPHAGLVNIQSNLPPGQPHLNWRGRFTLLEDLKDSIRKYRPDYVLLPSGDGTTSAMGLLNLLGRGQLPGQIPVEVGIHYGYGLKDAGPKNRLKDLIYLQTQRLSPCKKIHYVSVTNYDWICKQGGKTMQRRTELMPHPIPISPRYDKEESRRQLGLPEDGRYIGLAGMIDKRKAIPEFLAAFRSVAENSDRLLLTGRLHADYARLIEAEYDDLVRQRRLIILDGFFDQRTLDLTLGALDVVCLPYPRFGQLSAVMLQGIAAGKQVLVNDFGWMQAMVRRFGFGMVCDIHNHESFSQAIRNSLSQASSYQESRATRRLLEFHEPENFVRTWLQGIRQTMGKPAEPNMVTWPMVMEALLE